MPVIPSLSLSPQQQNRYTEVYQSSVVQSYGILANTLGLTDFKHDARTAVILDLVAAVVEKCQELHLNAHQTSSVLSIGQQLLQCCADGATQDKAQQLLRALLLKLCSAAPAATCDTPDVALTLTPDAIGALVAAFTRGILQHYSLYTLVFTQEQAHIQNKFQLVVESAFPAPPLAQALTEHDWQAHLAAEQAAREAEAVAVQAAEKAAREADDAARIAQLKAEQEAARQEQLQQKPKTLGEAVEKLVALRLEDVQQMLTAGYTAKTAALAAKVAHLVQQEQQQAAAVHATAKPGSNNGSRAGSAAKNTT